MGWAEAGAICQGYVLWQRCLAFVFIYRAGPTQAQEWIYNADNK